MGELKEKFIESVIHSIIVMIISLISICFVTIKISNIYLIVGISTIGTLFMIFYIKKECELNWLIGCSWVCLISVIFIGTLIGKVIAVTSAISIATMVSIMDIISFTKFGTKTTNAKVMANKNLMIKLIVYGVSFKNQKAVPTKGLGDFMLYTILLASIYKASNNVMFLFYGTILVFLGCVINWIIVYHRYDKIGYKGFPATFIPFLLVLPLLIKIAY